MLSDDLKYFFFFLQKRLKFCMLFSIEYKNNTPVFFSAGFLFDFEILHMQKLVSVVTSTGDCTDGNFP